MRVNYNRIQKDMINSLSKGNRIIVKTVADKTYIIDGTSCYVLPKERNFLQEQGEIDLNFFLNMQHDVVVGVPNVNLYKKVNGKNCIRLFDAEDFERPIYILKNSIKNIDLNKMILSTTENRDLVFFEDEDTEELVGYTITVGRKIRKR